MLDNDTSVFHGTRLFPNKQLDFSQDILNFSQIGFDPHENHELMMTNDPFGGNKPTSRFVDDQQVNVNTRYGTEFNPQGTQQFYGRNPMMMSKSMTGGSILRGMQNMNASMMIRGGDNSMIDISNVELLKTMHESFFSCVMQSDNEKARLLNEVQRLLQEKEQMMEREISARNESRFLELELKRLVEENQKEKEK